MKKFLAMLTVLGVSIVSLAQTKGRVAGTVEDGNQKTIESATIALLRGKDSSVAKVAAADKNGKFEFENVAEGKYLVGITAVGHKKGFSNTFEISSANSSIELKTISLVPQETALMGVTVAAKKPLIEQRIDRTIVNVEASVTNVGSSALEVLEKSPGISVDKDGNISLKGKQGVMVLVDGRPTQLSGSDLANLLRNMNANQLDQVEIMTNPPAKYDAAGNAGVINLKTKKNKQFGYNGSATVGYGQWKYPKFNESVNFNLRKNKVNFFTNLGHNYGESFGNLAIKRNFREKDTKSLISSFDQETKRKNNSNTFNGKVGMDYFAGKNTTFGFVVTGFTSDQNRTNSTYTNIFETKTRTLSKQSGVSSEEQEWKNFSTNLNFRQVLDTTGEELTADLDFIRYNSNNATSLLNFYFD